MRINRRFLWANILAIACLGIWADKAISSPQPTVSPATQTVEFLTSLGERTPNSTASDAALHYLRHGYEQAGYLTEIQAFQFQNNRDSTRRLSIG